MRSLKLIHLLAFMCCSLYVTGQNINVSGNISANTTWSNSSIDTVKIMGNTTVDTLTVLTIEPGIVIDFVGHYSFNVKGTLVAQGAASDSIKFTTSDTTGYYNNTHTGWAGIRFHNRMSSGDTSRLEFCVIEFGKADGTSTLPNSTYGGGLYTFSSWRIKIQHTSFRNNWALNDGGAWFDYYSFVYNGNAQNLVSCDFKHNTANGAAGGGAIHTARSYNLNFEDCKFLNNSCPNGRGGAIRNGPHLGQYSIIDITDSRFSNNQATDGGAISFAGAQTLDIKRTMFNNNSASSNAGALQAYGSNIKVQNSVFVNNEAAGNGGAVHYFNVFSNGGGTSVFANNTIAHNKALNAGGLYVYDSYGSALYVNKTIFYNNESTTPGVNEDIGMGTSINSNNTRFYTSSFTYDLTNAGVPVSALVDQFNLHYTNPDFISPSAGTGVSFDGYNGTDWSLNWCTSPCVNHSGTALYTPDTVDFNKNPREVQDTIDIGAFEHYGLLTHPQDVEVCEGEPVVFTSTYFYSPGANNSYWEFSLDHGNSWISDIYVNDFYSFSSANINHDSLLIRVYHDFGCQTIISDTAMLRVYPKSLIQNSVALCDNDSLFLEGSWQNTAGTYYDTLQSVYGCDSVIETSISINPTYEYTNTASICQGDSIQIYGTYQSTAGAYYDSLQTIDGCDSVYTTVLTVNPTYSITITSTICNNDSIYAEGAWQNTTGMYYDTLQSVFGCDSVTIIDLTVNQITTSQVDTGFCAGSSFIYNGFTYSSAGSYTQVLTNAVFCDSILTLNLIEYPLPNANIGPDSLWVCDGEELSFGIDTTGVASYSISNFTTTQTNDSLTFIYNATAPTSSVISNSVGTNGCMNSDQVVLVWNDIINMSQVFPSMNDPLVIFGIANMPSNVDFWYWSFGDGDTLSGVQAPTHVYTSNGTFEACLIAMNVCGIDSSCATFDITTVGLEEENAPSLVVYPNPGNGDFHFNTSITGPLNLSVYSQAGQLLRFMRLREGERSFSLEGLNTGYYMIRFDTKKHSVFKEVVIIK